MQGLVTLLPALGFTLFWQPEKRIAICSPPKVGTSFLHAWLVWSEVSPEAACRYGVLQLSSEAQAFCHDAGIEVVDSLYHPHNFSQLKMIRAVGPPSRAAGEAGAYFQSLMPRAHRDWRLFVLARDPWSRLMSGFSNKILHSAKYGWRPNTETGAKYNNETAKNDRLAKMQRYVPSLDARVADDDATPSAQLTFVLRALAERPGDVVNPHFMLQRDLCLHESYTAVLETGVTQLAPIDRGGFDEISVALGHGQSGPLSAQHLRFGDGATSAETPAAARPGRLPAESKYAHVVSGRRLPEAQVGCLCVATELLLRVYREFLAADYATLARFGLEYAVESKLNVSESALPMWARICGYEIAYVAECVEAPTPSATGFTRGASQRDVWSAGDDAVSSPLVMFSARCSGSTFEHSVLRQLLNLHNVTTTKAGNNSAIHWNALSGARTQLRAFQMSAARRNATLLMLVHNSETATNLSPTLHELGASVVHMYRENELDQVVCAIRDCIDDKDYRYGTTHGVGDAVYANGSKAMYSIEYNKCFERRRDRAAPTMARINVTTLLGVLESGSGSAALELESLRLAGWDPVSVKYEDLEAFQFDDAAAFERSLQAWCSVIQSFGVALQRGRVEEFLAARRRSRSPPQGHRSVIYNYAAVASALEGTDYKRLLRPGDRR